MDAAGIGSLNVDLIFEVDKSELLDLRLRPGREVFGTSEDFSNLLEIVRTKGKMVSQSGGGSAANTVCALSRMGFRTGLLGMVGKDAYGDFIIKNLKYLDATKIRRANGTGLCISIISDGERSLLVLPNANDMYITAPCDLEYLRKFKVVHLTSFVGERSMRAQMRIAKDLEPRVMVSLDPGEIYARKGLKVIKPLIERADIIFPSDHEIKMLTGTDPIKGAKKLLKMGPDIVVCTKGAEGAIIVTKGTMIEIPAVKTEVVDKTGAGDVFAAAMLAGMLKGWELEMCGKFAALASARSISDYGRDGYPDQEFLESFERETGKC
ncbi:MAG: carbohydrate kinase family protein [Methanomassiliicoccales archaeon]|nr:carbohydrate kinase family protein [Methanomassiliicoccales archaeon]NYT14381.1 carbohydrate kinase family protein [Methanomassiliicoccales archaeon]